MQAWGCRSDPPLALVPCLQYYHSTKILFEQPTSRDQGGEGGGGLELKSKSVVQDTNECVRARASVYLFIFLEQ